MVTDSNKMKALKNEIMGLLEQEEYDIDMICTMTDELMSDEQLERVAALSRMHGILPMDIKRISKEELMSNPYLRDIKIPSEGVEQNGIIFANTRIVKANLPIIYDENVRDPSTFEIKRTYCACDEYLALPSIFEDGKFRSWMTVEPFEINTFNEFIEKASGNVLLLGCGLGYAAYMLSLKDDVKSITIVDNNQDILDIFNNHILPQFKNKEKVRTVNSDAIEYLKSTDLSAYNHVNVDIWKDTTDMIHPYLRCLEIERENSGVEFSYWLERTLKLEIQTEMLKAICDYPNDTNDLITVIGKDIVKREWLNKPSEVERLINIRNLREFLYKWYSSNRDVVEQFETKKQTQNTLKKEKK